MGAPQNNVVIAPMDRMLTTGEAGKLLHVRAPTVAAWCDAGKLDCIRTLGGHRRVRLADILAIADPRRG